MADLLSSPLLNVGIMSGTQIEFSLPKDSARRQVTLQDGCVCYQGRLYPSLEFNVGGFTLYGVTIGVDFHWQRSRDLDYSGILSFIVEGDKIRAVNTIGVEDYLLSVISSEMLSGAPLEFLKAHAIISRSWLMRNLKSHEGFDVCADDHCQRYQGLDLAVGPAVRDAIDQTWGQLLTFGGEICDARYSKCCGGRTELFSTCWEEKV